jgi:hypothetical protein
VVPIVVPRGRAKLEPLQIQGRCADAVTPAHLVVLVGVSSHTDIDDVAVTSSIPDLWCWAPISAFVVYLCVGLCRPLLVAWPYPLHVALPGRHTNTMDTWGCSTCHLQCAPILSRPR